MDNIELYFVIKAFSFFLLLAVAIRISIIWSKWKRTQKIIEAVKLENYTFFNNISVCVEFPLRKSNLFSTSMPTECDIYVTDQNVAFVEPKFKIRYLHRQMPLLINKKDNIKLDYSTLAWGGIKINAETEIHFYGKRRVSVLIESSEREIVENIKGRLKDWC